MKKSKKEKQKISTDEKIIKSNKFITTEFKEIFKFSIMTDEQKIFIINFKHQLDCMYDEIICIEKNSYLIYSG